jgi:histone H2B
MTVSKRCVDVLDSMVADVFGRLATESKTLTSKVAKQTTMDSRTIQTAVKLVIPGELAKHAISEGTQAVVRFSSISSISSSSSK